MAKPLADSIRDFANADYVLPARRQGKRKVAIRAGDVHDAMNLIQRMPAVCSAIGSQKFEKEFGLKKLTQTGPHQGSNALFTFEIIDGGSFK